MPYVILAGQSNALGFGNTGPAPYTPTVRVQIWTDTNADGIGDAWHYMNPGVNTGTLNNPTAWGPEVQIANAYLADHATGFLWINKNMETVRGSTGLATDPGALDWSPSSAGEMFDFADHAADAARANLGGGPYAFSAYDALFWMQGETDAGDAADAAAYATNLAGFLAAARSDWMNDPAGYVGIGRITDASSLPYSLDVRQAQWQVDQVDTRAESFKTIGFEMQADGVHYAAAGQLALGQAFYDNWIA